MGSKYYNAERRIKYRLLERSKHVAAQAAQNTGTTTATDTEPQPKLGLPTQATPRKAKLHRKIPQPSTEHRKLDLRERMRITEKALVWMDKDFAREVVRQKAITTKKKQDILPLQTKVWDMNRNLAFQLARHKEINKRQSEEMENQREDIKRQREALGKQHEEIKCQSEDIVKL